MAVRIRSDARDAAESILGASPAIYAYNFRQPKPCDTVTKIDAHLTTVIVETFHFTLAISEKCRSDVWICLHGVAYA